MNIVCNFYKSVNFVLSDHYIIDDLDTFLNSKDVLTATDQKTKGYLLDTINVSFDGYTSEDFNEIKQYNYLRIEYQFKEKKVIHYYFVNNVYTSHINIFTFNITIDLLNTYAPLLIFSAETFIERQHEKMFLERYEYNGYYYFLRNIPQLVNFDFDIPELVSHNSDVYYLTLNQNITFKNFWLKLIYYDNNFGLVSAFIPYDGDGFTITSLNNVKIDSYLSLRLSNHNIENIFSNVNVWSMVVIPYCPIKVFINYNETNTPTYNLSNEPYFFNIVIEGINFLAIKVLDGMEYYNNNFLPVAKSFVPLNYVYQFGTFYQVDEFFKNIFIEKIKKIDYDAYYEQKIIRNIKEPVLFSSAFNRFVISNNDFNFELSNDDLTIKVPLENIIRNENQKIINIEFLPYFSEEKSIGFLRIRGGDFFKVKSDFNFSVPVIYELTLFNDKYRNYIDSGNFYVDKEILSNNLKNVSNNSNIFETQNSTNNGHGFVRLVSGIASAGLSSFSPFGIVSGIRGVARAFGAGLDLVESSLTHDLKKEKFNIEAVNLELQNRAKLNNYTFNRLSNKTVGNFELSYRRYEDFCFMFSQKKLHDENLNNRIAAIYYFYGSNVNKFGVPFHHNRIRFDYLRCKPKFVNIDMVANLGCLKLIEEFFSQGVTYIHHYNNEWVFPFSQIENVDNNNI